MRVVFDQIEIPEFGGPNEIPAIPSAIYEERIRRLGRRLKQEKLDAAVVYADREHSANMAYLTGFDPRFEEALFILLADGQRTLIVGNECHGILGDLPVKCDILLCQEFSLMGQSRAISWDLKPLLKKAGLGSGTRCGTLGWKTLREGRIELPAYIVLLLEETCGSAPCNANDLLMHEETGLRLRNEPEQIAVYEYAAVLTSRAILNVLRSLKPGIREFEAARAMQTDGQPLSCHPMLVFGNEIHNGMASPGNKRLAEGHRVTTALGVWGSLTCRAGLAIRDERGFAGKAGQAHRKVIGNYLQVTRAWYEAIGVEATGGAVWQAVERARNKALYTLCVNPGHYLHLDEWVSSPFYKGAKARLPSSAALQADIIPIGRNESVVVNMEDGVVLADAKLRRELRRKNPELLARCAARRTFMNETLGYNVGEDVLPLGNMPGAYFPFLLDTRRVCRFQK
jgi:hypothetical protein